MKTVRFELPIDVVVEAHGCIDSTHEVFRGEDKAGKVFLLVDKLTGYKQVAICKKPAPEEGGYATVEWFSIPEAAIIIDDEVKEPPTTKQVIEHISCCCAVLGDAIRDVVNGHDDHIAGLIVKEMDTLKSEGCLGSGISENTLLSALKIVTKNG